MRCWLSTPILSYRSFRANQKTKSADAKYNVAGRHSTKRGVLPVPHPKRVTMRAAGCPFPWLADPALEPLTCPGKPTGAFLCANRPASMATAIQAATLCRFRPKHSKISRSSAVCDQLSAIASQLCLSSSLKAAFAFRSHSAARARCRLNSGISRTFTHYTAKKRSRGVQA